MEEASVESSKHVPFNPSLLTERSAKLLFYNFCNNLYLGQWHLASSCARLLYHSGSDVPVISILKDVVTHPFSRSVLSPSVPSPYQLSWLCLQECERLTQQRSESQTEESLPDKQLVEFHLFLIEICPYITDPLLKELYLYYRWKTTSSSPHTSLSISPSLLKFVQILLSRQPFLGHTLVTFILGSAKPHCYKNDKNLHLTYISSVSGLLDELQGVELDEKLQQDVAQKIYNIFSYFDPGEHAKKLPLRPLLLKILEYCKHEHCRLSKTHIISVLIGRSNNHVLEEFCHMDYESETNNAVATYQACAELTEEQRWILHLSTLSKAQTRWRMFFLFCNKKKRHLLEVIMETGLALIKCRMFEDLSRLVEPAEFYPLKPLLLLLGWTHCYSSAEARQLLETLWSDKTACCHPALEMGCSKLAYQIDLMQWCLERTTPMVKEECPVGNQFQRAADLFKGLESHSVLYVLHNSTRLASLDQHEVLELLQKVPLQGLKDGESKKPKVVRFDDGGSKPQLSQISSLDQQKDMSIYKGYCILKNVMDAILFCSECTDRRLSNPVRSRSRARLSSKMESGHSSDAESKSRSGSSLSNITLDCDLKTIEETKDDKRPSVDAQTMYNENVTKVLTQVKEYLANLQPLTFRVELLENVFSLMFLTHEDVQEILVQSEYNSDDDRSCSRDQSTGADTPSISPAKQHPPRFPDVPNTANEASGKDYDEPFEPVVVKRQNSEQQRVEETLKNVKSKIIERLESHGDGEGRHHSSFSENISSLSNSSSKNISCFGFITNDYLVRDLLSLLKDCIIDVSAAKFKIHGNKADARERYRSPRETLHDADVKVDPSVEDALCRLVKSSVTMETLNIKIKQLEKHISEAQWRFQLVSNEHIPKKVGEVLHDVVISSGDSSDEEVEIKQFSTRGRHRKTSTGVSTVKIPEPVKRSTSVVVAKRPGGHARSQNIVSLMLSSPETLLTMSVRKGQLTQTKQIIKLLKLEARPEAIEVLFSQAFQKAGRSLLGLAAGPTSGVAGNEFKSGRPSMNFLANVAAAGVATASISETVDELLTFPTMPSTPTLPDLENMPQNILEIFNADNLQVMVLLDLTCSSASSWDMCNHMIDAIKSRYPVTYKESVDGTKQTSDTKQALPKHRIHKLRTIKELLTQLQSLLELGSVDQFSRSDTSPITRMFQKSLQQYMCQGVLSLNPEVCRKYSHMYQNLSKYIQRCDEVLEAGRREAPTRGELLLSSSDSLKSKPEKKSMLHHCVKQLINTLQTELPNGGAVAFAGRELKSGRRENRNYLLSLYDHCKELAYLVAESEAQSPESMVTPKNYFDVLEEGPLRILGRMMFTKKMPPAKLEKVAAKLSLNLTHIIVYSCCVKVPSKRLPLLQVTPSEQDIEMHSGNIVYNCATVTVNTSEPPEPFLRNILIQLVQLMKEIAQECNAEGIFDHTCADRLYTTAKFHDIISQTSYLQNVNLVSMDATDRKCFYGNLQTLMSIHCSLVDLHRSKSSSEDWSREMVLPFSALSMTEQIIALSMFSYKVGQLGIVSLFDLKYQINRCGLLPPSEWGRTLEHRLCHVTPDDPWFELAPSPSPQMLFAMTNCYVSSPPVQILDPKTLDAQLETCMKAYLETSVYVNKEAKLIKLPEQLLWYRRDFISDQHFKEYISENDGLIAFIASHMPKDKEEDIKALMCLSGSPKEGSDPANPFDIEVFPCVKDFQCVFDFKLLKHSLKIKTSPKQPSSMKSHSRGSTLSDSDITYNLTPNTLEYIKSDCPLVATLVSLMCADDFEETELEDELDEGHFSAFSLGSQQSHGSSGGSFSRSRAASSMSLVDIRSYRYEKLTNEYPKLKRHLLNYIAPLAATEDPDILKGDDPILKLLTSSILERFKTNMLSLHEDSQYRTMLKELLNEMLMLRRWPELLKILDCVPITVFRKTTSLCNIHDFVVCCLVHKLCSTGDNKSSMSKDTSSTVSTLLHRMICPNLQAREVLLVNHRLYIDQNIDLLQMCLCRKTLNPHNQSAVEQKLKQMQVYHRITECAKSLQIKLSMRSTELITEEDKLAAKKRHLILDKFTNWRTVVEWTKSNPREVLALLIKAGDFETAREWSLLGNLDQQIQQEIEENYIISLLLTQPPDTTRVYMILDSLRQKDYNLCLGMCSRFVDVFNHLQDVLFMSTYILNHLTAHLSIDRIDGLRLTNIGAKMILCLPESMHQEYSHIVSQPRLILEQLLMNMKPELAGKAFDVVRTEFSQISAPELRFTTEQFNKLVAQYAKRALEFTVIQYLDLVLDKERTFSVRSTSSDFLDGESPLMRGSPQPRGDMRRSADLHGSRMSLSVPTASSSPARARGMSANKKEFVMPSEPPPRDQWVADSAATVCMVCKVERFSMFNRRHHCRRCGRVVCASCSQKVTPIKGVSARTCDDCYGQIVKSSTSDQPNATEEGVRPAFKASGSSPMMSPHSTLQDSVLSRFEDKSVTLSQIVSHTHTAWKLQLDDTFNETLREDFFYEQAPSTSLCISILNLHGNPGECGHLILNLCDDLSKFLKPLAPGVPNPEVDYNLIMSMMKYLLFHAKIKFTECGDNAGMGQCDKYQGLVDLLGHLVVDNYKDLPSILELTKVDSVRRLRDKLIEDERLQLAMEVTTKCGLEPAGVWSAWGLICLQSGDFTGAREKFTKCLKPMKDKNMCTPNSKILTDIIDLLETMPGTGSMEIQILLSNPGSMKNLINTPSSTFFEEASMDSQQFQECVYYLRTYGSYLSLVDFHRRHGYYMKSVQYILDHRCSTEVFVEGLLRPSLESGELGRLTDQMLMIDPSLERWNHYLTAACRFFFKKKLHHVLYEFQLFMKDFIRAGMSCFSYFYQEGAQSYTTLAGRIQHLFQAQQHMQAYLDPAQWGNVQHPLAVPPKQGTWKGSDTKSESVSVRLVMQTDEVNRMMRTIGLQIEVTKFFEACFSSGQGRVVNDRLEPFKLPTLFASNQVRNQLAILIILCCGDNVDTSLPLANKIIKEYKLGAVGIYTHAAREFAKGRRYGNMHQLVTLVQQLGINDDDTIDEILGACLLVVADNPSESKEADNIIKSLRKESNKINAYILCSKLRSAYLLAVKDPKIGDRMPNVRRILRAAKSMGQSNIVSICNKWIEQNQ